MPNETAELFALAAKYFLKKYKENGGTQVSLSKELGITQAYISSVINGSRSASFDLYTQIADKLYGPLDKFLIVGRRIKEGQQPLVEEEENNGIKDDAEHLIARLTYYILDHRRMASEIEDLKQFYESIVENLQSAVLVMDDRNEVIYANSQIRKICGISPDEAIGINPFKLDESISRLRMCPFIEKYSEAYDQLKPLYYENIQFLTPEGSPLYISGWLIPVLKENAFNGMICTLRDTTQSFTTFSLLTETVEHVQDAVVVFQQNAPRENPVAFFANKKFRTILGFDDIDPFSLPFSELVEIIKRNIVNKKEWEEFITNVFKDNPEKTTFIFEHNSGKKYFARGNPIYDRQGIQIGRLALLEEMN